MVFRLTKDKVGVGTKAPDFALPSHSGGTLSLKDFLGRRPVVLYFYPKDDTLICTKEACAFRDDYREFAKLDAEVIGIRVPCKTSREVVEADEGATEVKERFVDVVPPLVAHRQPVR